MGNVTSLLTVQTLYNRTQIDRNQVKSWYEAARTTEGRNHALSQQEFIHEVDSFVQLHELTVSPSNSLVGSNSGGIKRADPTKPSREEREALYSSAFQLLVRDRTHVPLKV